VLDPGSSTGTRGFSFDWQDLLYNRCPRFEVGTHKLNHEIVGHVEDEVYRLGVGSLDIAMDIE
jgi:hypothetical protein